MSRRCRPGIRARIVGDVLNRGAIVVVVRYYFGEIMNGSRWPQACYPWVVTSLGAPLRSMFLDTRAPAPPAMTIVVDDSDLEPLDDSDDGLDTDTPVERPTESAS